MCKQLFLSTLITEGYGPRKLSFLKANYESNAFNLLKILPAILRTVLPILIIYPRNLGIAELKVI